MSKIQKILSSSPHYEDIYLKKLIFKGWNIDKNLIAFALYHTDSEQCIWITNIWMTRCTHKIYDLSSDICYGYDVETNTKYPGKSFELSHWSDIDKLRKLIQNTQAGKSFFIDHPFNGFYYTGRKVR